MDYKDIAAKLLKAFEDSPYSYGELSKLTGIPKSALQRYITGDTGKIPMDRLRIICEKLGLDAAELLGWDDGQPQNKPGPETNNGLAPKTLEARIVSFGMDSLPKEEREKILSILQTMYNNNPDLFKEESTNDA